MNYKTVNDILKDKFVQITSKSKSRSKFFRKFGFISSGGEFETLNNRIQDLNINMSHLLFAKKKLP